MLALEITNQGMIKIPIKKTAYQFAQVDAEAASNGTIGNDHVSMPLDNMWNFGYIGEFYLGSGTPQKTRALFDTGSANSWIISKEAVEKMDEKEQE